MASEVPAEDAASAPQRFELRYPPPRHVLEPPPVAMGSRAILDSFQFNHTFPTTHVPSLLERMKVTPNPSVQSSGSTATVHASFLPMSAPTASTSDSPRSGTSLLSRLGGVASTETMQAAPSPYHPIGPSRSSIIKHATLPKEDSITVKLEPSDDGLFRRVHSHMQPSQTEAVIVAPPEALFRFASGMPSPTTTLVNSNKISYTPPTATISTVTMAATAPPHLRTLTAALMKGPVLIEALKVEEIKVETVPAPLFPDTRSSPTLPPPTLEQQSSELHLNRRTDVSLLEGVTAPVDPPLRSSASESSEPHTTENQLAAFMRPTQDADSMTIGAAPSALSSSSIMKLPPTPSLLDALIAEVSLEQAGWAEVLVEREKVKAKTPEVAKPSSVAPSLPISEPVQNFAALHLPSISDDVASLPDAETGVATRKDDELRCEPASRGAPLLEGHQMEKPVPAKAQLDDTSAEPDRGAARLMLASFHRKTPRKALKSTAGVTTVKRLQLAGSGQPSLSSPRHESPLQITMPSVSSQAVGSSSASGNIGLTSGTVFNPEVGSSMQTSPTPVAGSRLDPDKHAKNAETALVDPIAIPARASTGDEGTSISAPLTLAPIGFSIPVPSGHIHISVKRPETPVTQAAAHQQPFRPPGPTNKQSANVINTPTVTAKDPDISPMPPIGERDLPANSHPSSKLVDHHASIKSLKNDGAVLHIPPAQSNPGRLSGHLSKFNAVLSVKEPRIQSNIAPNAVHEQANGHVLTPSVLSTTDVTIAKDPLQPRNELGNDAKAALTETPAAMVISSQPGGHHGSTGKVGNGIHKLNQLDRSPPESTGAAAVLSSQPSPSNVANISRAVSSDGHNSSSQPQPTLRPTQPMNALKRPFPDDGSAEDARTNKRSRVASSMPTLDERRPAPSTPISLKRPIDGIDDSPQEAKLMKTVPAVSTSLPVVSPPPVMQSKTSATPAIGCEFAVSITLPQHRGPNAPAPPVSSAIAVSPVLRAPPLRTAGQSPPLRETWRTRASSPARHGEIPYYRRDHLKRSSIDKQYSHHHPPDDHREVSSYHRDPQEEYFIDRELSRSYLPGRGRYDVEDSNLSRDSFSGNAAPRGPLSGEVSESERDNYGRGRPPYRLRRPSPSSPTYTPYKSYRSRSPPHVRVALPPRTADTSYRIRRPSPPPLRSTEPYTPHRSPSPPVGLRSLSSRPLKALDSSSLPSSTLLQRLDDPPRSEWEKSDKAKARSLIDRLGDSTPSQDKHRDVVKVSRGPVPSKSSIGTPTHPAALERFRGDLVSRIGPSSTQGQAGEARPTEDSRRSEAARRYQETLRTGAATSAQRGKHAGMSGNSLLARMGAAPAKRGLADRLAPRAD